LLTLQIEQKDNIFAIGHGVPYSPIIYRISSRQVTGTVVTPQANVAAERQREMLDAEWF